MRKGSAVLILGLLIFICSFTFTAAKDAAVDKKVYAEKVKQEFYTPGKLINNMPGGMTL